MCLPLSFLCVLVIKAQKTQTQLFTRCSPPCCAALLLHSQGFIHLNNGEEKSASVWLSVAPLPPCIFEDANQSVYLTKFTNVPLLKKRMKKGRFWIMNCELLSQTVCLSFCKVSSGGWGRFNVCQRNLRKDSMNFSSKRINCSNKEQGKAWEWKKSKNNHKHFYHFVLVLHSK